MSFERVLDQKVPKRILSGALKNDLLASSYLFYGDQGTGKWVTALELAKAINCEKGRGEGCGECSSCLKIERMVHPDVKMIFPVPSAESSEKSQKEAERFRKLKSQNPYAIVKFEKNVNIPVERIRAMQREIALKPFEAKRKVIIIEQAEKMHVSSANSLLKTLEEPPADSNLILTSDDVNKLLPTVVSRCQQIRFAKIPTKVIAEELAAAHKLDEERASYYANVCNGSYGRALDLLQGEKENLREDVLSLLDVAADGGAGRMVQAVRELLGRWDRNSVLEMFEFLAALLRDVRMLMEGSDRLINSDLTPQVVKLSRRFKRQNTVEEAFLLVEQIRTDCQTRNASQKLALLRLGLEMRRFWQKEARAA